jgi:AcrR family transcriptional regulator
MTSSTNVRPRQRGSKALLSRELVVLAALDCLRDGGPAALTMRGLAARLETGPSSLYAWVSNQRALHVLVLDAIAAEVRLPNESDPTAEQMVGLLLEYGRRLFSYPGSAQLSLDAQPTGPAYLDLLERCLTLLEEYGLAAPRAAAILDTLFLLVAATAAEQDARRSDAGGESVPDLYDAPIAADAGRWPRLAAAHAYMRTTDGEQRLAQTIRTFLKGLKP